MTTATPPSLSSKTPPRMSASRSAPARDDAVAASYEVLASIRLPNGLYLASPSVDYSKVWLRDTYYEVLPFLTKPTDDYERTYHALLDVLRCHEWKVDAILRRKPSDRDEYIHPRYHAETLREIDAPWGNKQNDAIGALLFGIAQGLDAGKPILRDARDARLVQKLARMLEALHYWHDADNGIWEEDEEVHASSVGACLAGLAAMERHGVKVPRHALDNGRRVLDAMLPRESTRKRADLALLSLVWPFGVARGEQARAVVRNVEERLLRERGVIRYEGDSYYSTLAKKHGRGHAREFYHGTEAEWTFGLPWLSLCWRELGDPARADMYLERTLAAMLPDGSLPELYFAGTDEPNPNTPLGWSQALFIVAAEAQRQAH